MLYNEDFNTCSIFPVLSCCFLYHNIILLSCKQLMNKDILNLSLNLITLLLKNMDSCSGTDGVVAGGRT